jgi:hypothetical protein
MHKAITINFKYSNVFAFRAICKNCGGGPIRAYFLMNKDLSDESFKLLLKRPPADGEDMMINNNLISVLIKYRVFKPNYLFNREAVRERSIFVPNSKFEPSSNEISCKIECECGLTSWQFTNSKRKHIYNRKAQQFTQSKKTAKLI